jgi:hypothetical protein
MQLSPLLRYIAFKNMKGKHMAPSDLAILEAEDESLGGYGRPVLKTRGAVVTARILSIIGQRLPGAFHGCEGKMMRRVEGEITQLLDSIFSMPPMK